MTPAIDSLRNGDDDELFAGAPDKPSPIFAAAQISPASPTVKILSVAPLTPVESALPPYPPIARIAHVEGTVAATAELNSDGAVASAVANSGHPMLKSAAIEAIKTWKFPPSGHEERLKIEVQFATNCSTK